jgi:outer membrane cobalamin receptor
LIKRVFKYSRFTTVCLVLILYTNVKPQDSTLFEKKYSLDEITVNATKLNTKLKDVSTKVEIIDTKKIEASNGTRLPDILKRNSGTFIKSYGLTSALQTISTNGLGAEHTLILMDGVRLNSFQNSQIDLSLIPKENIERIEIINNGISSIYGSDALGGVVNIISKNRRALPGKNRTQVDASVANASYNTGRYSLGVYQEFENFNARIYYTSEKSDGDFKYHYNNGIETITKERENGSYSLYDAGINAQYIIDENNFIRLISSYSDQDKHVPGIETGSPPSKTKQLDRNWNNILVIENAFSKDISLKSNFNFQNNYQRYMPGALPVSYYKNIVYSAASELNLKKANYGITSGYNYSHAYLISNEAESGTRRNQHAMFVSSFYNIFDELKIFPSTRYDYISDIEEGAFTYKLGLNYQPFRTIDFSIKGNAGKNFRSPSFNDLYWKNSGNKDLKPEKSTNFEAGLFYSFSNVIRGHIEFTYTFIKATNKIVWTPQSNGLWAPQNVAESESNNFSVSSSLSKHFSDKLIISLDAGLLFIDSKKTSSSYKGDATKDKFVPYVPLQSSNINLGVQYRFTEFNLFYTHTGKRYSDYANTRNMSPVNLLDGNITVNFNFYQVASKIKFEVNNILDTDYELISGYPMPLRNYFLTLFINY